MNLITISDEQLIGLFGTQKKVADVLGISPQAVSNWVRRGQVPKGQRARLVLHLSMVNQGLVHTVTQAISDTDAGKGTTNADQGMGSVPAFQRPEADLDQAL